MSRIVPTAPKIGIVRLGCPKAMRGPGKLDETLSRINKWRRISPDLVIRSTFIVGFPGETEEDFQMLLDWLEQARLKRVGCFKYESVAGSSADEYDLWGALVRPNP